MRKYQFGFYFDDPDSNNNAPADGQNDGQNTPAGDDKKYSDADLDRIIGEKFAKWQKKQQAAVDEAKRLAEMSAQERAEAERDALQKELDALKAANTRAEMERTARSILAADGVNIPDALIATLVRDEAEATSEAVKAFSATYKAAIQAGITAQLAGKTPPAGNGAGTLTKADIMKEKDPLKRQKLIKENMKLFR